MHKVNLVPKLELGENPYINSDSCIDTTLNIVYIYHAIFGLVSKAMKEATNRCLRLLIMYFDDILCLRITRRVPKG